MAEPLHKKPEPPATPVDTGSTALAEALRGSFVVIKFVMLALLVVFLFSGFFTVGPQEKAIILRFGKPVGRGDQTLLGSGGHWAWPYPIDEVVKVPFAEIQTTRSTVGWYAQTPEQELQELSGGPPPYAGPSLNPAVDGYVLTAEGNIVHSRATLRFRIEDPIRYVFDFTSASNAVVNALNNALIHTAASYSVDQILTSDKAGFQGAVGRRFEQLAAAQNLGVAVEQCTVQSREPRQLTEAFARVNIASQNRSKQLNDARSAAQKLVNQASAEAQRIINLAESSRTLAVTNLAADADRFRKLRPSFERNPGLFVEQELVRVMASALTNVQTKILLPEPVAGKSPELRLLLSPPEPSKPAAATTP